MNPLGNLIDGAAPLGRKKCITDVPGASGLCCTCSIHSTHATIAHKKVHTWPACMEDHFTALHSRLLRCQHIGTWSHNEEAGIRQGIGLRRCCELSCAREKTIGMNYVHTLTTWHCVCFVQYIFMWHAPLESKKSWKHQPAIYLWALQILQCTQPPHGLEKESGYTPSAQSKLRFPFTRGRAVVGIRICTIQIYKQFFY